MKPVSLKTALIAMLVSVPAFGITFWLYRTDSANRSMWLIDCGILAAVFVSSAVVVVRQLARKS